jgi:hypothetical protein
MIRKYMTAFAASLMTLGAFAGTVAIIEGTSPLGSAAASVA